MTQLSDYITKRQEEVVAKAMRICTDLHLREETVSGIDEQKPILDLAKMNATTAREAYALAIENLAKEISAAIRAKLIKVEDEKEHAGWQNAGMLRAADIASDVIKSKL